MPAIKPKYINISYNVIQQSSQLLSTLHCIQPNLQRLSSASKYTGAQNAVTQIRKLYGIEEITADSLCIKHNDKNIVLSFPNSFTLILKEQTKDKQNKEIQFRNGTAHALGFKKEPDELSNILSKFFEDIDETLFKLRLNLNKGFLSDVLKRITPKAQLHGENAQLIDEIRTIYNEIQAKIDSIDNIPTRSKIKNGYQNIKKGIHGSKQIDFEKIGYNGEDYSLNIITARKGGKHTIIKISHPETNPQYIIANSDGKVQKSGKLSRVINIGEKTEYYTQQEIDSYIMTMHFNVLKKELEKYNQYLDNKINSRNILKSHFSTGEIGIIEEETLTLNKEVKDLFYACKSKMLKIKDAPRKNAFKKKYGIDTIMSSPCLIFRDINAERESLALSFPVKKEGECTKIIILKPNGNIKRSLFVNEDKLVKFDATSMGRSKRSDTKTHYFSQEEIDNSGLKEFLQIVKSRLEKVPISKK